MSEADDPHEASAGLIALDWGSSSLRAWLIDQDGQVLDRRQSSAGVLAVESGAFRATYEALCREWLARRPSLPVIASGMIGSRQGWREARYLETPADPAALARNLLTLDDEAGRVFRIVPGLSTSGSDGLPDVMRGEETQILGMLADHAAPVRGDRVVVLPGTHSKWVRVRDGAIVGFRTWMTGEMYAVLREHSILGKLAAPSEWQDAGVQAAFEDGVGRAAAAGASVGRLLFSVRSRALLGELTAEHVLPYLSGLLIGSEIDDAWRIFGVADAAPLVIGEPALTARYECAFQCLGRETHAAPPDAAMRGLLAIARSAGLVASVSPRNVAA